MMYFKDNALDYIHGFANAIAIKREGENEYNQMAGKEMYAYVRDGEVYLVDVMGNAETVFYPREEDGSYIGVNKTQSSYIKVYLKDRLIDYVLFTTATSGVLVPLSEATDAERFLVTFFWAEQERPRRPGDIFLRPQRTPRPDAQAISAAAAEVEEDEDEE